MPCDETTAVGVVAGAGFDTAEPLVIGSANATMVVPSGVNCIESNVIFAPFHSLT